MSLSPAILLHFFLLLLVFPPFIPAFSCCNPVSLSSHLVHPQVIAYRDAEGRSGLEYVVQVATQLLSPATSEHTATFVGRLITALIRHTGDHLGDNLDLLLRAVLSKLQVSLGLCKVVITGDSVQRILEL